VCLFEIPGFSPQLEAVNGSLSLEKDSFAMSNDMDIDWVCLSHFIRFALILIISKATWDTFVEVVSLKDEIIF